jgi:hypothetical protein
MSTNSWVGIYGHSTLPAMSFLAIFTPYVFRQTGGPNVH